MNNIPATPQTTALFKSVAAPVSYYTGQPDVSIPIYTISQDGVQVPISISFNTSGIFVNEEATNVGIGVRLNWGGSIVRSANGRPDERGFFNESYKIGVLKQDLVKDYATNTTPIPVVCFPYCNNPNSLLTFGNRAEEYHSVNTYNDPYKTGLGGRATDLRPDDFYYNFLGKSGLFKFNQQERKFVTFPLDDIRIDQTLMDNRIQKFVITKSDGVKITLGDGATESTRMFGDHFDQSWFVKKITTIKNSTIDFLYVDNEYGVKGLYSSELRVPYLNGGGYIGTEEGGHIAYEKLINSINFKEGKLDFVYVRDRLDINATANDVNNPNAGLPAPRLSKIILSDNSNNQIRIWQFYQSYFVGNRPSVARDPIFDDRLKLDSLYVLDNVSNGVEKYRFEYHSDGNIPSKRTSGRDHWGYYNGADNNQSLIPSSLIPLESNLTGLNTFRDINSATKKVFTIKKIKFPTGFEREYNFEDNKVRWYELFSQMKDLSNDGYDVVKQELLVRGESLSDCFPTPDVVNSNNTERTVYGNEFTVQDYNDVFLGDPSLFVETTFINPAITHSQLNLWAYSIEIGLEKKSGGVFSHYQSLTSANRDDYSRAKVKAKLPFLPDGVYRIYVKMITPPSYVMSTWYDQYGHVVNYGHNTIVRLSYRNKNFSDIRVGGLRIKEIIDRENQSEYKTTYDYTEAGNFSSGHLFSIPHYKEYIVSIQPNSNSPQGWSPYYGYRICSESVLPITKTQGSIVGYTNVVKRIIGGSDEIKEEFSFSYKPSLQAGYLKEYYKETEPKPWQSGKLLSNKKYKGNVLLSEDTFDYYGLNNEIDKGSVEEINTSLIKGAVYGYAGFNEDKWDIVIDRRHDNPVISYGINLLTPLYSFDNASTVYDEGGKASGYPYKIVSPPVKIPYFRIYSGFDKLKSKTTNDYNGSNIITQTENYYYESLPAYQGLSRIERSNSLNETLISRFYYPHDLPTEPLMPELISSNRIGAPVKTERYNGLKKLHEEKFVYAKDASTSNLVLPKSVYAANFPNTHPNITDPPVGQLERQVTYDKFDVKGNLVEYHKENEISICSIWSYNYQYPVVEIKNLDYASIVNFLGESALNAFSLSMPNKASIDSFINPLKVAFPTAQISTYTFTPLVGMTSATDAKGMITYYEYDGFQRLKHIKDQQGNIVKSYEYHYKP
ncbi:hypothetical protein EZ444_07325 [Pedobacter hiemivivus]|uniref:RHS repeat protein n=2 Tax=Pedobacter hiemivivus TaxID=2530454 RepID=A0A4R0NBW1_9SPHI|nr:hypothetical protein EZ444_07325 [Pedobacter hiemivivus]